KGFGGGRVEAGDEIVVDAVRARYRRQGPVLIELPEQDLVRPNQVGDALVEASVERAERGACPGMDRYRQQGFYRQLPRPFNVERGLVVLFVEQLITLGPTELRAHMMEHC